MKIEQIYTGCLAQGAYYIESNRIWQFDTLSNMQRTAMSCGGLISSSSSVPRCRHSAASPPPWSSATTCSSKAAAASSKAR